MSTELTSDEQRAIGEACRDLHIAHVEYRQVEAGWLARAAYERPSHPGRQAAIEAAAEQAFQAWTNDVGWDGTVGERAAFKAAYRIALAEQPRESDGAVKQEVDSSGQEWLTVEGEDGMNTERDWSK